MSTTNGTRALLAAREARAVFAGALVNAAAVAAAAASVGSGVTLLCAGTDGSVALEDVLGAGAVMAALGVHGPVEVPSDVALMSLRLFDGSRADLPAVLRQTRGGRNVVAAGLESDVDFAARLDSLDVVGVVAREAPVVRRWKRG
jgi:2-phosphosulfolactate phosphatase